MTGFRTQESKGAGEVQLVLTAALLHKMGYAWWDLGMVMKYKGQLGAKVMKRDAFAERLHQNRDMRVACQSERIEGQPLLKHLLDVQAAFREGNAEKRTEV